MSQSEPIHANVAGAQIRAQRAIDERLIAAIFGDDIDNAAACPEAPLSPIDDGPLAPSGISAAA